MKLIEALAKFPKIHIFRVEDSDGDDQAKWDVEPISSSVLSESEGFFILKGINVLADRSNRDCYVDVSLPERINDYAYFFDGKSLKADYPSEFEGDIICAVPIDCFGLYELFYSKINPEVGIAVLNEGLTNSPRKRYIAEDLGYILRDEGRFREAAEMFQVAVDETPSSYFIYGELAACYAEIGEGAKAEKYQTMFAQENKAG